MAPRMKTRQWPWGQSKPYNKDHEQPRGPRNEMKWVTNMYIYVYTYMYIYILSITQIFKSRPLLVRRFTTAGILNAFVGP